MSLKSPSKYYSLSYLLAIKENSYYLKYDFQPEEVDNLIWSKQQKLLPKDNTPVTHKACSCCKVVKALSEFHRDPSKKLKKRSHCKSCRKPIPF